MKDIIKTALLFCLVAAVWFWAGKTYGRKTARNPVELAVIVDTVQVTKFDTITRERPVYVAKTTVRHDTVRFTTLRHDTVLVDVPIERKVYHEDSVYHAVVSGYRPSLDSLLIFSKTTTITVTNTPETIFVPSRKRWSFGITAGPSVLATPSGQVHAGLGATIGFHYRF